MAVYLSLLISVIIINAINFRKHQINYKKRLVIFIGMIKIYTVFALSLIPKIFSNFNNLNVC